MSGEPILIEQLANLPNVLLLMESRIFCGCIYCESVFNWDYSSYLTNLSHILFTPDKFRNTTARNEKCTAYKCPINLVLFILLKDYKFDVTKLH